MQVINSQDQELYHLHHNRAKNGDIESQFKLGEFYERGQGVTKNIKLAELLYAKATKATEKKHQLARLKLSWLHLFDPIRNNVS